MEEKILNFPQQFAYAPVIENGPVDFEGSAIVAGMGGSHLGAGLLKIADPALDFIIHTDYGLPALPERAYAHRLVVASSYSGNTEETVDALETAIKRGMHTAVLTRGGRLLEIAREKNIPAIVLPSVGIQPRFALGYQVIALARIFGNNAALEILRKCAHDLTPKDFKEEGNELAKALKGKIPIIYTSRANAYLGYVWKVKINESAKIPAFASVLPEANHNEMNGFDVLDSTREITALCAAVFLRDPADDVRIVHRMDNTRNLYRERGVAAIDVALSGSTPWHTIFNATILADWLALALANYYGTDPENVPMIEQFKKLIY